MNTKKTAHAAGKRNDCTTSFRLPRSLRLKLGRAAKRKKESLAEYIKTAIEMRLEYNV